MNILKMKTLTAAVLLVAGSNAYADTIDLFTTDQAKIVSGISASTTTAGIADMSTQTTLGTDIVGGERDLYVQSIENVSTVPGFTNMKVEGSALSFNNEAGIIGIGQVQWDGIDGDANFGVAGGVLGGIAVNGLGGFDLTDGGTLTAFELITFVADAEWQFGLTIFEFDTDTNADNNAWVRIIFDVTEVSFKIGNAPHTSNIDFRGFALGTSPCGLGPDIVEGVASVECSSGSTFGEGIDLTNVGAIVADFNTGDAKAVSVDLILSQVETVPEPSVLALMGLGLFSAGFANRRKKA